MPPTPEIRAALASYSDQPEWPYIIWFAAEMQEKLAARRNNVDQAELNRGGPGWHSSSIESLMLRLREEYLELLACEGKDLEIVAEAIDVANFAMMIANNAKRRHYANERWAKEMSLAEDSGRMLRFKMDNPGLLPEE